MTPDRIRISEASWAGVVTHLTACLPEEGCGLLAGRAGLVELVVPIENAEHSSIRYSMEPRELVAALGRFESLGLEMLGAFHSHPGGPFGVSDSDVREWQYPEAALVVCVPWEETWRARAFIVEGGRVAEVPLQIE
jgi:proteasome lid subunit RPN8/RPN11